MAELRVFVSSTCYDLSLLRSQLRTFIKNMGYEPIMRMCYTIHAFIRIQVALMKLRIVIF